jgi:probable HAF family extracellular repeat protein
MSGFFASRRLWVLLALLAGLVHTPTAPAAPDYTITDLGTLGGTTSIAEGLNNAGQVVGYSDTTGDVEEHAFLYSNGVITDLGTLGGTSSQAVAINNSAQIVGVSATVDSPGDAFLYSDGVMTDLGTPGGSSQHRVWNQ